MDPGDGYKLVDSKEPLATSDEYRSTDGSWSPIRNLPSEYLRTHRARMVIRRKKNMCGCGKHEIPEGADKYAAHREYEEKTAQRGYFDVVIGKFTWRKSDD